MTAKHVQITKGMQRYCICLKSTVELEKNNNFTIFFFRTDESLIQNKLSIQLLVQFVAKRFVIVPTNNSVYIVFVRLVLFV